MKNRDDETLQVASFTPSNFSDNIGDMVCRQLGYNGSVDWFGLLLWNNASKDMMSSEDIRVW